MSFGASKGSSKSASNQTQSATSSETPNNLPFLQKGWNLADQLFGSASGPAGAAVNGGIGNAAAGANAATGAITGALGTAGNLANGATVNGANQYLTPFANGSMSGNNPYFQNTVDMLAQSLRPQIDGSFGAAGRYGSGANAHAFADALSKQAGGLAYQNYGDMMNRQLSSAGQLSANNTNSTGQQINALDVIRGLGSTAAQPGATEAATGGLPQSLYAQVMSALGAGGGTQNSSGTANGTATGNTNSSGFSANLMDLFKIPGI